MTGLDAFTFAATGAPRPQGSKTIGRAGRGGRPIILEGRNARQRAGIDEWRKRVALEATLELRARGRTSPYLGPLAVELLFVHRRPASTPRAHRWRSSSPDVDKLARTVLDALTIAGVIGDDRQVADLRARKVHALPDESDGVVVTVRPLEHAQGPESVAGHLPAPTTPDTAQHAADRTRSHP